MRQFLLQMAGEPGTGKSTLARAIGRSTGAVVLDKDYIKAPLLDGGLSEDPAEGLAYDVFFSIAASVLDQGHSIVLDSPAFTPGVVERGQKIARKVKVPYRIIECCCDRSTQEVRVNSRRALSSQLATMEKVLAVMQRPGIVSLEAPHLTVDTTHLEFESLKLALSYLVADDPR